VNGYLSTNVIFVTQGGVVTDPSKRTRDAVNKIFGDPLRELSVDEPDSFSPDDATDHDQWLRENIPPHHD
jgi:hypothetical protein